MDTDPTLIGGSVRVEGGSGERVALELMQMIRDEAPEEQDRMLELYARCLLTTRNPNKALDLTWNLTKTQAKDQ